MESFFTQNKDLCRLWINLLLEFAWICSRSPIAGKSSLISFLSSSKIWSIVMRCSTIFKERGLRCYCVCLRLEVGVIEVFAKVFLIFFRQNSFLKMWFMVSTIWNILCIDLTDFQKLVTLSACEAKNYFQTEFCFKKLCHKCQLRNVILFWSLPILQKQKVVGVHKWKNSI